MDFESRTRSATEADPGLPVPNPTTPYWQLPLHDMHNVSSTALPETTDVVIIGSGITGCSVAKGLLEGDDNLKITVLEARGLLSGASSRNGGHIVSSSFESFLELVKEWGAPTAAEITEFTLKNIDRTFEMVENIGDPEFTKKSEIRRTEKILVFQDQETYDKHAHIMEVWNKEMPAHRKDWYKLIGAEEAEKKYGFHNIAGAAVGTAAAVWPYRLWCGVWEILSTKYPTRLTIETYTPATAVKSVENPEGLTRYIISTPRGEITASKVVYCTNGFGSHLLPQLRGKVFPLRGTMSVQDLGPSFPNHGAHRSWSIFSQIKQDPGLKTQNLGLYYLTQNPHSGYMFLGGEHDDPTSVLTSDDSQLNTTSAEKVVTILPKVFADAKSPPDVKSIWSGIMGFTRDGIPIVGNLPEMATGRKTGDEWIAAGFNGYGTGYCLSCGLAVAGMMLGKDVSPWFPEVFKPSEKRLQNSLTSSQYWGVLI